jgi:hypothetical protein
MTGSQMKKLYITTQQAKREKVKVMSKNKKEIPKETEWKSNKNIVMGQSDSADK